MPSDQYLRPWVVQELEWDTAMLGISSGMIQFADNSSGDEIDFHQHLSEALCEARQRGIRFLTAKLSAKNNFQVNACLAHKGLLVDTELTYSKRPGVGIAPVVTSPDIRIDRHTNFWDESLEELAGTLRLSRFFRDPHIPVEAAERLWQTSLRNSCQGRASYSLIAFMQGKPAAVINIFEHDGISDIFLIAVLPAFQGMGLGRAMLSRYDAQLPEGITKQTVETQVDNYSAQALYVRMGYLNVAAKYTLHFWL